MPLQRITHAGAAPPTNLLSAITATAMSFGLTSSTGYPTGAGGPFVIDIDAGLPTEEKVLCASLSGGTVTVVPGGRGWDGTIAVAHTPGTALAPNVTHIFTSSEADDANAHIYDLSRDDHSRYALASGARQPVAQENTPLPTTLGVVQNGPNGPGNFIISGFLRVTVACTVTVVVNSTDEAGNVGFYLIAYENFITTPVGLNAAALPTAGYSLVALGSRAAAGSFLQVLGQASVVNAAWLSTSIQQVSTI